jgi:hypothetical protein
MPGNVLGRRRPAARALLKQMAIAWTDLADQAETYNSSKSRACPWGSISTS